MSLPVIVQLIRNFLCVVKSLLPEPHILQYQIFQTSNVLSSVTALEFFIAITQLAAVIFNFTAGFGHLKSGFIEVSSFKLWGLGFKRISLKRNNADSLEISLLSGILNRDLYSTIYSKIIVGFLEIIFAISFLFLTCNSLHLHFVTHPKPVIDALIFMEIGLVYFLFLMIKSILYKLKISGMISKFKSLIGEGVKNSTSKTPLPLSAGILFGFDAGFEDDYMSIFAGLGIKYEPSWRWSTPLVRQSVNIDEACDKEIKDMKNELSAFQHILDSEHKTKTKALKVLGINDLNYCLSSLDKYSAKSSSGLLLDIVYLLLNTIAGYGYMMGIVAFYFPDGSLGTCSCYGIVKKAFMLGLDDKSGDWWGNVAGDAAWAIEPLLILTYNPIANFFLLSRKQKKPKKD